MKLDGVQPIRRSTSGSIGPAAARRTRVLIVQSHPLLAAAIGSIVEAEADLELAGIAGSAAEALSAAERDTPDVVVIDYRLADAAGAATAAALLSAHPTVAIVFHSAEDSETAMLDAVDAGAVAYLTKDATAQQIAATVRQAAGGDVLLDSRLLARAIARQRKQSTQEVEKQTLLARLTPRELEVLRLLAAGLETQHMAMRLGIATHTVEWHVRHLIEKLQVHSKLQAVIEATRRGLIEI